MATARISQAPPPNVDPSKATLAFGVRAIPRLKRELDSTKNDLLTVQRALMALCDLLRDPKSITEAVHAGLPADLGALLNHVNDVVREKATEALHHFAAHAVGRDEIIAKKLVQAVSAKYGDGVGIVRLNAHTCIERTSKFADGGTQVIDCRLVPALVQLLPAEEEEQIQTTILDTLHNTLKVNPMPALDAGAIGVFTELLGHNSQQIVWRAARNIMGITVPLGGKNAACAEGVLEPLIKLLTASHTPEVINNACAALMSIAITTEGKLKMVEAGVVKLLPPLLDHEDERVLLNAIKLITTVSEAPRARAALLESAVARLEELKGFRGDRLDVMAVSRSATTAVDTITWTP